MWGENIRDFNYSKISKNTWDSEVLGYIAAIYIEVDLLYIKLDFFYNKAIKRTISIKLRRYYVWIE